MDFIKGNEQVRIDPSGIDISGVGNIIIDSNSITGDISFNNKVNFTGDVSMNGKVTVSEILDVTGDVSMSGILDMCGNIKFDDTNDTHITNNYFDTHIGRHTMFDETLVTWTVAGAGSGWTMMKNLPPNSSKGFNESSTDGNFTQQEGIESLTHVFGRPTSDLTFTPDEVLFTTILNNGDRIWWIFDYTKCANTNIGQPGWVSGYSGIWSKNDSVIKSKSTNNNTAYVNSPSGTHIFANSIYLTSGNINPTPFADNTGGSLSLRLGPNSGQYPIYRFNIAPGTASTDYNTDFLYYRGMSIFFRDSTNIPTNPIPYPTLIKKESDHLHITAPLNIYPEGNYELDDLGVSGAKDLKLDGNIGTGDSETVDNAGGWYLVRQANGAPITTNPTIYNDNFHFGFSYGTKENGPEYSSGHLWARNVSNYDYDEVLFEMLDPTALNSEITKILWQIWDRTSLETLMSRYDDDNIAVTGIKKSSVSDTPHTVEAHVRPAEQADPQIYYSYPGLTGSGGNRVWNVHDDPPTNKSYYVRRSDGQPVRLKNKVKVDVDGNLDVDGIITCSRIAASTTDTGTNGLTVTSGGFVGIGTSAPTCPLHVESYEANFIYGEHYYYYDNTTAYPHNPSQLWTTDIATTWWNDLSIRAKKNIWTEQALLESSDQRIKTDISNVNDDRALQQINRLESKEYHYIDPERRRPTKTIGFIAQEVKEVIPNAVSLQKEWIPDEMRIIANPQWENNTLTILNVDMSGNFTGKAKFYVANDPSGNDGVCKEVEIKEVHTNDSTPLFPKTKFVAEFDKPWANVFFYGKEVSDFHTIDKNKIFALHHSAIQELSRKNDSLKEEVSAKTAKITSLETRLEALETALLAMQSLVEGLH